MAQQKKVPVEEQCIIEGCERKQYSLEFCRACYQRAWYWDQKTLAEKMHRIKNLRIWDNAMERQIGNVRDITLPARRKKG